MVPGGVREILIRSFVSGFVDAGNACIVHQHIDPAEAFANLAKRPSGGLFLADIEMPEGCSSVCGGNPFDQSVALTIEDVG